MEVHDEDEVKDDARDEYADRTNLYRKVVSVWLERVDELIKTCSHFDWSKKGNETAVYQ